MIFVIKIETKKTINVKFEFSANISQINHKKLRIILIISKNKALT